MFTIIESESNAWMIIATDGDLRVYSRQDEGEWSEVSLENADQADRDKSLMLEELYGQQADQDEADEDPEDPEAEGEEAEGEDEEEEDDEEGEEGEPEQPRRRRSTAAAGRRASRRK